MNRGSNPRGAANPSAGRERDRRHSGDVVKWLNTEVCKTSIHRFESDRRLQSSTNWGSRQTAWGPRLPSTGMPLADQPQTAVQLADDLDLGRCDRRPLPRADTVTSLCGSNACCSHTSCRSSQDGRPRNQPGGFAWRSSIQTSSRSVRVAGRWYGSAPRRFDPGSSASSRRGDRGRPTGPTALPGRRAEEPSSRPCQPAPRAVAGSLAAISSQPAMTRMAHGIDAQVTAPRSGWVRQLPSSGPPGQQNAHRA